MRLKEDGVEAEGTEMGTNPLRLRVSVSVVKIGFTESRLLKNDLLTGHEPPPSWRGTLRRVGADSAVPSQPLCLPKP